MDEESKIEFQSPWKVENLDEYLFYCCPECDHKTKTKSLFIDHACKVHEGAKEYLVQVKIENDSLVINSENLQIKLEEAEEEYEYEDEAKLTKKTTKENLVTKLKSEPVLKT